jgi:hypothetical protein
MHGKSLSHQGNAVPAAMVFHGHKQEVQKLKRNPLTRLMCCAGFGIQSRGTISCRSPPRTAKVRTVSEISGRSGPHTLTHTKDVVNNRATGGRGCMHKIRLLLRNSSRANLPPQRTPNPGKRAPREKDPSTATVDSWTESVHHVTSSSEATANVACGRRLGCLVFRLLHSVFREAHGRTEL